MPFDRHAPWAIPQRTASIEPRSQGPRVSAATWRLEARTQLSMPMDPSDEALVARMAQGDRTALSSLYGRHAPKLLGLLVRMLGAKAEAEDLLHDVFLEVWRHAPDYVPERGSVRAWLTTRTRSRALDKIKSAARRRSVPTEDAPEPSAPAPVHDDHRRLQETLLEMPENQREVLLLAYFEDLSASEIAGRLGIPLGTVKSRTRAALTTLRDIFGEGATSDGAA